MSKSVTSSGIARFTALYEAGESCRSIARLTGWSRSTVHAALVGAGVAMRHLKGPTFSESEEQLTCMWREYVPVKQIAVRLGVHYTTASQWIGRLVARHGEEEMPPIRFDEEVWRAVALPHPLCLKYEVSSDGRVRSTGFGTNKPHLKGHVHTPLHRKRAYSNVGLSSGHCRVKNYMIHRLVTQAFYGDPPSVHHTVNHRNGVKHDNRVENLEWSTPSQQARHSVHVLGNMPPKPPVSTKQPKIPRSRTH